MKKVLALLVIIVLTVSIFANIKVALLLNGTLGDKSFFDSSARGVEMAKKQLGMETKVIEMGYNPSEWEPTLEDISASGKYDVIIVGTWQMVDPLARIAPKYPKNKYFIFDTEMDYSKGNLSNVYSIVYKQNEGSFLAGALAGMVTKSTKFKNVDPKNNIIGFLGGQDIPVINDFLVGYIEGAKYVNKDIKVAVSYVGAWNDPAKGKEFTLSMYRQGADVVFAVAGETGNGVLAAAKEMKKWGIGVDSDMQLLYEKKDMEIVNSTLTSMLKNVDLSILRGLKLFKEGKLKFGVAESLGLKENGVGLADNKYYQSIIKVDPAIKTKITQLTKDIVNGKIKVSTANGMSNDQLNKIRDTVRPK